MIQDLCPAPGRTKNSVCEGKVQIESEGLVTPTLCGLHAGVEWLGVGKEEMGVGKEELGVRVSSGWT